MDDFFHEPARVGQDRGKLVLAAALRGGFRRIGFSVTYPELISEGCPPGAERVVVQAAAADLPPHEELLLPRVQIVQLRKRVPAVRVLDILEVEQVQPVALRLQMRGVAREQLPLGIREEEIWLVPLGRQSAQAGFDKAGRLAAAGRADVEDVGVRSVVRGW